MPARIKYVLDSNGVAKSCTRCNETKPIDGFFKRSWPSGDGHESHCKECKIYNKRLARKVKRFSPARNPMIRAENRISAMIKVYKISFSGFLSMFRDQGGRCKICRCDVTLYSACIDHNHNTGNVRGLLCHACNSGIAFLRDDVINITNAKTYIIETNNVFKDEPTRTGAISK